MNEELAERTDGAIRVRLLWNRELDEVAVEYHDLRTGDGFTAAVPKGEALVAYYHPHLYRPLEPVGV